MSQIIAAVRCPTVVSVEHGHIQGSEVTFGSTIRYTCDDDYRVAGLPHFARAVVRRCEADARWNGTEVRCEGVEIHKNPLVGFSSLFASKITFVYL